MFNTTFACLVFVTFVNIILAYPCRYEDSIIIPRYNGNVFKTMPCKTVSPCRQVNYYKEQLILPPKPLELPCGLGYGYAALPTVAEAYFGDGYLSYEENIVFDAFIPVSSDCVCVKIATPIAPVWEALAKPIIL